MADDILEIKIEVIEDPNTVPAEYSNIPIPFKVERILDVDIQVDGPGAFIVSERSVNVPYVKDYDAIGGGGPAQWSRRFNLSNWGLFAARLQGQQVGGAAVVLDTAGANIFDNRTDRAVLWDIRVSPKVRGQGVGSALFRAAEAWAMQRGCRELMIETQNINVPACRFYARHGCVLKVIDRFAYPEFPDEAQLLWCKDLTNGSEGEVARTAL